MFKFLGRIFGTEKALGDAVGAVRDGLDALVYTDEEKARDAAQDRSEARSMVVGWMRATQGQNLARRFLAVMIAGVWLLQYMAGLGLDVAAVWADNAGPLQKASTVIGERAVSMNGAMMLILGFYFAAPHMGSIAKVALARFGKGKTDET
nr:hypothetical protein 17 [Moraxellaceae bacterium]